MSSILDIDETAIPFTRKDACQVGVLGAVIIGCINKAGRGLTPEQLTERIKCRSLATIRRQIKKLVAAGRIVKSKHDGKVVYVPDWFANPVSK